MPNSSLPMTPSEISELIAGRVIEAFNQKFNHTLLVTDFEISVIRPRPGTTCALELKTVRTDDGLIIRVYFAEGNASEFNLNQYEDMGSTVDDDHDKVTTYVGTVNTATFFPYGRYVSYRFCNDFSSISTIDDENNAPILDEDGAPLLS